MCVCRCLCPCLVFSRRHLLLRFISSGRGRGRDLGRRHDDDRRGWARGEELVGRRGLSGTPIRQVNPRGEGGQIRDTFFFSPSSFIFLPRYKATVSAKFRKIDFRKSNFAQNSEGFRNKRSDWVNRKIPEFFHSNLNEK